MKISGLSIANYVFKTGTVGTGSMAVMIEVNKMFGFTLKEWQIIAIILTGFAALGGLVVTSVFKWLHYRLEVRKARIDDNEAP